MRYVSGERLYALTPRACYLGKEWNSINIRRVDTVVDG